jgi:hypothetical protein
VSAEQPGGPSEEQLGGPGDGEPGGPSEEELRRRLEEEVRNLRIEDVILQSVVSIVNLTARRIGKEDERDLEQARVGIDAVRSLVDLLPEEPGTQIRNALSELQMLYAREAGAGEPSGDPAEGAAPAATGDEPGKEPREAPPSEPSTRSEERRPPSRLWTPPGSG